MRFIALLLATLFALPAAAETQTVKQEKLRRYLGRSLDGPATAVFLPKLNNVRDYDTAVELLADSPAEGALGYAIDTNAFYVRTGSSWVAMANASGILGSNGGTLGNETDGVWTMAETSEDWTFTFAANSLTMASSTGAVLTITPAVFMNGLLSADAGIDVDGVTTIADITGDITTTATIAGERGWELFTTAQIAAANECGRIFATATNEPYVTLPAVSSANAGCCYTLLNTSADGTGETGFSLDAADAIFGEIANSAQDSAASGTVDQALKNTKATAIKGDRVTVCSDGVDGYYIMEGVGIWASVAQ